jgi:uncharacterized membrane protein
MNKHSFSIKEAVSFGWDKMKKHFWFLLIFLLVLATVESIINEIWRNGGPLNMVSNVGLIAGFLLSAFINLIVTKVVLDITNDKVPSIERAKEILHRYLDYVFASFLTFLIIFAGFLLLIVPGVVWSIKYSMVPYLIVDKKLSPFDALKESARMTEGKRWQLFLFGLLLLLINIAGAVAFGIGVLATIPTAMIAYTYAYKKLSK